MSKSGAEKIQFILNNHEQAYRRLKPVYTFLERQFERKALVQRKRLVRTVLIFTESSDQLSRATDRVPGLPASPGYVQ